MSQPMPDDSYFEFTPTDRSMAVLELAYPSLIRLVIDLDGEVDLQRLNDAWQLMVQRYPILACTAAWRGFSRRWMLNRDQRLPFLSESDQGGSETRPGTLECKLLGERLDVARGPIARLAALNRAGSTRLLLTVHHSVTDAWGVLATAEDLRSTYEALAQNPRFTPVLDPRPRTTRELLKHSDVTSRIKRKLLFQAERNDRQRVSSTHGQPLGDAGAKRVDGPMTYARIILPRELMAALKPVRTSRGWTVNDVLLGLLTWSWEQVFGSLDGRRSASGWVVAVDLRGLLGTVGGPGVLSGLEFVALEGIKELDLANTIAEAKRVMDQYKLSFPGLGTHIQLSILQAFAPGPIFNLCFKLGHRYRMKVKGYNRTFTNIGVLPESLALWGRSQAKDAFVLAPLGVPPSTIISASTFRENLSLNLSYQHPWLSAEQIKKLEQTMRNGVEALL